MAQKTNQKFNQRLNSPKHPPNQQPKDYLSQKMLHFNEQQKIPMREISRNEQTEEQEGFGSRNWSIGNFRFEVGCQYLV
jgi:hypothetical protein